MSQLSGKTSKYWKALFIYWLILLLWQNFALYVTNSVFTLIIKMGLIVYLLVVFFHESTTGKRQFWWFAFLLYCLFSFLFNEPTTSPNALTYYFFPAIFALIVFVFGERTTISLSSYIRFLKAYIWVVFLTAVYGIVVQGNLLTQLLLRSSAYGYEMTSFFTSNHEYGMYLAFAIASILICYNTIKKPANKAAYILLLLFFAVNLLATLSRTSIVSTLVILVVFGLLSRRSSIKWIMLAVAVLLVVIFLTSPRLQSFLDIVVWKSGDDAGRSDMWESAIDYFSRSTTLQKLFGHGYSVIGDYTRETFSHGSVHNSFLQVVLVWGLSGLALLIGLIVSAIRHAIQTIKYNKNLAFVFLALALSSIAFMFTNTSCLMQSPIDSYMLTVFTVIMPKYVYNAYAAGSAKESGSAAEAAEASPAEPSGEALPAERVGKVPAKEM